ncbi:ribosomal protein L21e-domain-containing protein [Pelagophyceae sp. CCMP2097]|nr:ribosomal protein L21e-domain-containing protein [Pelagophyceae sp. CCMP2097]
MPHSFGYRARTRAMFSRPFRTKGMIKMSTYMTTYKVGDYVDIKCNPAQVKGMPFKHYHGRTGVIYNVGKRAVGVRLGKQINGRIINKHLNIRLEHILPSKCKNELITRVRANEAQKKACKADGAEQVSLKRLPKQPHTGFLLQVENTPTTIMPVAFSDLL